jgi:hypothetical protein
MMMLLAQDPIEKLAFISTKFFEATYITKIQNLKNMHGQEMDVLQNNFFRLIKFVGIQDIRCVKEETYDNQ